MSANRVKNLLGSEGVPQRSAELQEPFGPVPGCFYEQLSPERFAALQQVYRVAFERAQKQVLGEADEFNDLGAGI